jgi:hypothetical protein
LADESIKLEKSRSGLVIGADGALGFAPATDEIDKMFRVKDGSLTLAGVNVVFLFQRGMDVKRAVEQKKLQAEQSRNYRNSLTFSLRQRKNNNHPRSKALEGSGMLMQTWGISHQ